MVNIVDGAWLTWLTAKVALGAHGCDWSFLRQCFLFRLIYQILVRLWSILLRGISYHAIALIVALEFLNIAWRNKPFWRVISFDWSRWSDVIFVFIFNWWNISLILDFIVLMNILIDYERSWRLWLFIGCYTTFILSIWITWKSSSLHFSSRSLRISSTLSTVNSLQWYLIRV